MWTPAQIDTQELLDLGAGTLEERQESLRDLRRLNRWVGGIAASRREVGRFLARSRMTRLTLLDLGTGSGDVPAALQRWARRRRVRIEATGIDCKPEHLALARRLLPDDEGLDLACADAFRLPFRDASVDVVHSALFLHHFRPPQLRALLREAMRVARRAVIMNDLVRHAVPLVVFRCLGPVLVRSQITRHDAVASLRRAYTSPELAAIAREAGLTAVAVRGYFPYRQCLVVEKCTPATS